MKMGTRKQVHSMCARAVTALVLEASVYRTMYGHSIFEQRCPVSLLEMFTDELTPRARAFDLNASQPVVTSAGWDFADPAYVDQFKPLIDATKPMVVTIAPPPAAWKTAVSDMTRQELDEAQLRDDPVLHLIEWVFEKQIRHRRHVLLV